MKTKVPEIPETKLEEIIQFAKNSFQFDVVEQEYGGFSCNYKKKKIYITKNISFGYLILYLLHEIGHIITNNKITTGQKFFSGKKSVSDENIQTLEEEILAWNEAESLLNKFDLNIDKDFFIKVKQKSIETYIPLRYHDDYHL